VFEEITRDRTLRPHWDANRFATVLAAVVVHAFTLLAIGAALSVAWWSGASPIGVALAVGLLAFAPYRGGSGGRLHAAATGVDDSHPPAHLMPAFIAGLTPPKGTVELSDDEAAAIDAEILGRPPW
jgi:hypothetical protein